MSISKRLFAALGLLAAALALTVLAPRAARAVAAVLVQDADAPGRHPFVKQCIGSASSDCVISAPPDQRVVLQYVSAGIFSRRCFYFTVERISEVTGAQVIRFPCVSAGPQTWVAQGPMTYFIEPGSSVFGFVEPGLLSDESLSFTLTGYTITP